MTKICQYICISWSSSYEVVLIELLTSHNKQVTSHLWSWVSFINMKYIEQEQVGSTPYLSIYHGNYIASERLVSTVFSLRL